MSRRRFGLVVSSAGDVSDATGEPPPPYSAAGMAFWGVFLLILAACCLAHGAWPFGLVVFALSAIALFHAAACLDGRALARRGLAELSS